MQQIGAFQAKNTLGSLLDRVEAGEEILITRHGKPSAVLSAAPRPRFEADRARAHAALERMSQRAKEMKLGPFDWEEWKAYRDEGRR
ncbi:MAG TPA: type II toxin-antitoxin system prevent-host-death family antitoxin [Terracidiphilus sp.]|jgi:prevent-host-death family protein